MKKNRVEEKYTEILKTLAEQYFDNEVNHAHELFGDAAWPSQDDPHYIKKTTFVVNARTAHLRLLKSLAQHIAGAVHMDNTPDEKTAAKNLLQKAKIRISSKSKQADVINIDSKANE